MRLDDRSADAQSHAHSAVLGREEAVEQAREVLRLYAGATVLDRAAQGGKIGPDRADGDVAVRTSGLRYRLHGVDSQIDDHLLQQGAVYEYPLRTQCWDVRDGHAT